MIFRYTRPMLSGEEVAPGVARLAVRAPTLPPATHTNSYALGTRQVLLIEPATPYADEQRVWLEWARALETSGRELQGILVTHHHHDHIGGAAVLARELGLDLWAHRLTAERLPHLVFARILNESETIRLHGPAIQDWTVLHTPGHAPGHLCLHDATSGVMVVGDMVASDGTILIDPSDGDMAAYLHQLKRLSELTPEIALPAHGAPISSPSRLLRMHVRLRMMREESILSHLEAFGSEGATPQELVARAYRGTQKAAWVFALRSLESHIKKLADEGRAQVLDGRYVAAPVVEGLDCCEPLATLRR